MGISWNEMINTPAWVIEQDLEIIDMENRYGHNQPEKKKGKK